MLTAPATGAPLASRIVDVAQIGPAQRAAMFALFARYYADVDEARFAADLAAKDFVLLLECGGRTVGFTTGALFAFRHAGEDMSVLYSGDTVVERAFWGEQELARAWLRQAGRLAARQRTGTRLVWFLIVKGHRTYRYLPVFARRYVPSDDDSPALIALRNAIAAARFGAAFDSRTGVIRLAAPAGRLRGEWAEPTGREERLPGVSRFLADNPDFRAGDELACLCDLSPGNMRPRARRWFDEGFGEEHRRG